MKLDFFVLCGVGIGVGIGLLFFIGMYVVTGPG